MKKCLYKTCIAYLTGTASLDQHLQKYAECHIRSYRKEHIGEDFIIEPLPTYVANLMLRPVTTMLLSPHRFDSGNFVTIKHPIKQI